MKVTLPDFRPHPGQVAMLRDRKKRNVARMGRRFGKTELLKDVALNWPGGALCGGDGTGRRGLPCAWYAPNDSYFTEVFAQIAGQYDEVIRKATTQPRPIIRFINGGGIDFWTLEDPMKCGRGKKYSRVVVDEAAHARHLKEAWEQTIVWTLADLDGDAWFISTPKGINFFKTLADRGDPTHPKYDPEWITHHAPSTANPYLPPGWIEKQRNEMPELVFSQEVLAEFVTFGAGLLKPYHILRSGQSASVARLATTDGWKIGTGVDLAISTKTTADYSAIVTKAEEPDTGRRHTIDVRRGRWTMHETLGQIGQVHAAFRPGAILVESVQYQAAVVQELLRTTSMPVFEERPDRDKVTRFMATLARYEKGMEFHAQDLPDWYEEELLAFPEGGHDDAVDASVMAGLAIERCNFAYAGAWGGKRT